MEGEQAARVIFLYIIYIVPRRQKTFLSDFHSSELVQCEHDNLTNLESGNSAIQLASLTPYDLENIIFN